MKGVVVWTLLAVAVLVAVASALAAALMRDPLQRLHYVSPPTTLSVALVTLALFVDDPDKDVGAKAALVAVALAMMNGVVAHATARGARVRGHGTWLPVRGERVRAPVKERA